MSEPNEKTQDPSTDGNTNPQKCERCGSTEEVTDTLEVPWWDWLCKKCRTNPEKGEDKSKSGTVSPVR